MRFRQLIIIGFCLMVTSIFAQTKIGYVDTKVITEKYSEAQTIANKIKDLQKKYEDQYRKLQVDRQSLIDKYETQKLTLTQAKKDELVGKIQSKERELQNFQQTKLLQPNGELFVKVQEIQAPLIGRIVQAISVVAKEKKLDVVLDNVNSVVLYTNEAVNYTADVLRELEKKKN